MDSDDYVTELTRKMSEAWRLAGDVIKKAQGQQKQQHDVWARATTFTEGHRVFVFMHAGRSGKAYKLARLFHGPYRVGCAVENGLEVGPVNQPHATPIGVALNQVRRCSDEMSNSFWPSRGALNTVRGIPPSA